MKNLARITVVAGLSMMGAAVIATPAFAATTAPSCIARNLQSFNVVKLTNNCGASKRLKVIWAQAPDSDCFTLAAGATVTKAQYQSPLVEYDKTVLC